MRFGRLGFALPYAPASAMSRMLLRSRFNPPEPMIAVPGKGEVAPPPAPPGTILKPGETPIDPGTALQLAG